MGNAQWKQLCQKVLSTLLDRTLLLEESVWSKFVLLRVDCFTERDLAWSRTNINPQKLSTVSVIKARSTLSFHIP